MESKRGAQPKDDEAETPTENEVRDDAISAEDARVAEEEADEMADADESAVEAAREGRLT